MAIEWGGGNKYYQQKRKNQARVCSVHQVFSTAEKKGGERLWTVDSQEQPLALETGKEATEAEPACSRAVP